MDIGKLNVKQLKAILHELKEKTSGNKSELLARLYLINETVVRDVINKVCHNAEFNEDADVQETTLTNGEDEITKLKGEVAMLNSTVNLLVQKLQALIPGGLNEAVLPMANPQAAANIGPASQEAEEGPVGGHETTLTISDRPRAATMGNSMNDVNGGAAALPPANLINEGGVPRLSRPLLFGSNIRPMPYDMFTRSGGANDASEVLRNSSQQSYGEYRDFSRRLPEYWPGRGLTSTAFVDRVEQLRLTYGWSDQHILNAVYEQLKGPARDWCDAMPVFQRWEDFVQSFLADFPDVSNSADMNMMMMQTRMNRNESIAGNFH